LFEDATIPTERANYAIMTYPGPDCHSNISSPYVI